MAADGGDVLGALAPGAAVAIVKDDKIVYAKAFGVKEGSSLVGPTRSMRL